MPLYVVHQYRDATQHYRAVVDAESPEEAQSKAERDELVGDWIDEGSSQFDDREIPLEDIELLSDENDPRPRKSGHMNKFQKAVAQTYGDGDYSHLIDTEDWRSAIEDCGDTLFKFLMIELSDQEGCIDKGVATARLLTALSDVSAAENAVHGIPD